MSKELEREDHLDEKLSGQSHDERLIDSVCAELNAMAFDLKAAHTVNGDWPGSERDTLEKHDHLKRMAVELRKLKAAPAQPEPSSGVPEWKERLTEIYRRESTRLGHELNNLRSEYHNRTAELETEIEDLQEELQRVRHQTAAAAAAAPTPEAGQSGEETVVWLGHGDKLVADIYGADGSWAGVGIFQPTDGKTYGIGEPDSRIDGQPTENTREIATPLLSIRSHKPESLQVVIDELQESLDRMGYTHPHNGEQGGEWRHWYALSYRGTDLESGHHADAVTYIGFPDNALTLPRILQGKTDAGVSETAVLISATYCGYMTKTAFTGQPPKSKEGEGDE